MKATLLPRENVRLAWFKAADINFNYDRKVELIYYQSNLQQDTIARRGTFQIIFQDVPKQVPESQIIIFDKNLGGLPQSYGKTTGSVGSRLSTNWDDDLDVEITDRLVSYVEGKEVIKHEPPSPNLRSRLKEIEIRERDDLVTRKIVVKNLTARRLEGLEGYKIVLFENKDIRFESSPVELFKQDPPEYTWLLDVPADATSAIEFTVKIHTIKTFEIEKDLPHIIPRVSISRDNASVEQDLQDDDLNKIDDDT
ncbi:MAG TPA: hypothetical protein VKM55_09695 [Candidatus Lokiarchaeia archaeon]|nr:hypothetical protein [Candidatus Lokiarchaeia archaeon]